MWCESSHLFQVRRQHFSAPGRELVWTSWTSHQGRPTYEGRYQICVYVIFTLLYHVQSKACSYHRHCVYCLQIISESLYLHNTIETTHSISFDYLLSLFYYVITLLQPLLEARSPLSHVINIVHLDDTASNGRVPPNVILRSTYT